MNASASHEEDDGICQEHSEPMNPNHGHGPFSQLLAGLARRSRVILPEQGQCSECGLWDIEEPAVREAMVNAGRDPAQAQCRCDERAEEHRRRLWSESNLPHMAGNRESRTLENYERVGGTERALAAVRSFMEDPDHVLALVGDSGTGKTHLLEAIGRHFLELGRSVHYDFVPDFLDELRNTYGGDSQRTAHALIARRHNVHILLLDDVGQGSSSEWAREKITAVIDKRYRDQGGVVIATNLTRAEMGEHMGFRLASRLWERQGDSVRLVHLTCRDHRDPRRESGENATG